MRMAEENWMPSNGTDLMLFQEQICGKCRIEGICKIPFRMMTTDEAPRQWFEGPIRCTAFVERVAIPRKPDPAQGSLM